MKTPGRFTGGWRRQWLQVGDAPAHEPATVTWLQAGDSFVDLRIADRATALSGPGAFGGKTTFSEPDDLTWAHLLDFPPVDGPTQADIGRIEWTASDTLIEQGSFTNEAGTVQYRECWQRIPDAQQGPMQRLEPSAGQGLGLRCGQHLIAMLRPDPNQPDIWDAVHLHRSSDAWVTVAALGDPTRCSQLADALAPTSGSNSSPQPRSNPTTKWTTHDITYALAP